MKFIFHVIFFFTLNQKTLVNIAKYQAAIKMILTQKVKNDICDETENFLY